MKKILFVMAAVIAMGFVSCGQCVKTDNACDTDTVAIDSVDTLSIDSLDSVAVDSFTVDALPFCG